MPRNRTPLVLLILAAFAALGCSGGDGDRVTASPGVVDFGHVLQGDVVKRTVTLHNGGTRDVTITGSSTNCACFKLHPFGRLLHPGEDRTLTLTFLSSAVSGGALSGKVLDILTDDPAALRIQVPLVGQIVKSIDLYPASLDLGVLGDPSSLEPKTVHVRPGTGMSLELVRIGAQPREQFQVEQKEVDGGFDFIVQWRPPEIAGTGPFLGSLEIRVRTGGAGFPTRELQHVVRIKGKWPAR